MLLRRTRTAAAVYTIGQEVNHAVFGVVRIDCVGWLRGAPPMYFFVLASGERQCARGDELQPYVRPVIRRVRR